MYNDIVQKQETETMLQVLRGQKGWTEMARGKGHWGHRGRKGKRGGSLPSKGRGAAVAGPKAPTSHTTAANAFSKAIGLKTQKLRPPAVGHGKFSHSLSMNGDRKDKVGKTLQKLGYEKFKDPMASDIVTSYKHKNVSAITAAVSTQRVMGGKAVTRVKFHDARKAPKAVYPGQD